MKIHFISIGFLVFFVFVSGKIHAQVTFSELFEKAKCQSAELVSLEASRVFSDWKHQGSKQKIWLQKLI